MNIDPAPEAVSPARLYVALSGPGGRPWNQTGPLGVGIYAHADRLQALGYGPTLGLTRLMDGSLLRLSSISDEERRAILSGLPTGDQSIVDRLESMGVTGIWDDVYSHGSVFILKTEALGPVEMEFSDAPADRALPFIGYMAEDGTFESYDEHVAAAADYHHSFVVRDLDAYADPGSISFVRMDSAPNFTLRGEALIDPYEPANAARIGALASRLIDLGADPDAHLLVEDMGLTRAEAPYQGRNIGTLALWRQKDPAQLESAKRAEELRRWFGASSLVDEAGRPRVYHRGEASGELPDRFRIQDTHLHTGFFFSESPAVAAYHAGKTGERDAKAVDTYHLRAVRVLDLTTEALPPADYTFMTTYFDEYDEWIDRGSGQEVDPWDFIQSGTLYSYEGGSTPSRWLHLFRMARANGYDGVKVMDTTEIEPAVTVVVFDPDQIRSTTRAIGERQPARQDLMMRLADPLGSDGFARWCDGAELVDAHSFEARNGHPVVLRLFHGTLGDFDRFDLSRANEEAFLGRAIYASSCAHDASVNYASRQGPDVLLRAETLLDQIEDAGELTGDEDQDQALLAAALGPHDGLLMPVYVKLRKPAVILRDGGTFIPFDHGEPSPFDEFLERLRNSPAKHFLEESDLENLLERLTQEAWEHDGMYLSTLVESLRTAGVGSTYGESERGHVIADFLSAQGYDGIIDYEVKRFGKWVPGDAVHVMAFSPGAVKSALGNRGTYDPSSPSILERLDGPGKGLSVAAARMALRRHFGPGIDAMIQLGRLQLVEGPDGLSEDVPDGIAEAAQAGRLKGLADKARRQITLVPRSMRSADELITSFYHEVGEHIGLEAMLGRRGYRRLLARVEREAPHSPALQAGIRRLAFEQPGLTPAHAHYWPEVIAYAGETPSARREGWWADIKRGVTRWLIRNDLLPRRLSDDDLHDLLRASAELQVKTAMRDAVQDDKAAFASLGATLEPPRREHDSPSLKVGLLR